MLMQLVESRRKRERLESAVWASLVLHAAAVGILLGATGDARGGQSQPPEEAPTIIHFPPAPPEPPRRTTHASTDGGSQGGHVTEGPELAPAPRKIADWIDVDPPDLNGPPLDVTELFGRGRRAAEADTSATQYGDIGPLPVDRAERAPVVLRQPQPGYPTILRDRGVEGSVLAQFVIDTLGAVVPGSIRILAADQPLFENEVRRALERARYRPARIGSRSVAVVVEQHFTFSLDR